MTPPGAVGFLLVVRPRLDMLPLEECDSCEFAFDWLDGVPFGKRSDSQVAPAPTAVVTISSDFDDHFIRRFLKSMLGDAARLELISFVQGLFPQAEKDLKLVQQVNLAIVQEGFDSGCRIFKCGGVVGSDDERERCVNELVASTKARFASVAEVISRAGYSFDEAIRLVPLFSEVEEVDGKHPFPYDTGAIVQFRAGVEFFLVGRNRPVPNREFHASLVGSSSSGGVPLSGNRAGPMMDGEKPLSPLDGALVAFIVSIVDAIKIVVLQDYLVSLNGNYRQAAGAVKYIGLRPAERYSHDLATSRIYFEAELGKSRLIGIFLLQAKSIAMFQSAMRLFVFLLLLIWLLRVRARKFARSSSLQMPRFSLTHAI